MGDDCPGHEVTEWNNVAQVLEGLEHSDGRWWPKPLKMELHIVFRFRETFLLQCLKPQCDSLRGSAVVKSVESDQYWGRVFSSSICSVGELV